MSRTVEEWIGKTDDSAIPQRVRLRRFDAAGGKCACCGRKIGSGDKWDADHITALINGGENRETNIQILCGWCHGEKTKEDVAIKAKTYAVRSKHVGVKKRSTFQNSRGGMWKTKIGGRTERRHP